MAVSKLSCLILTISDTCSIDEKLDTSGPYLVEAVKKTFDGVQVSRLIIKDDLNVIEKTLVHFSDVDRLDLIITTGGTGFTERDVTPEATKKVIDKEASGISTAMCVKSLEITQMAMLSRSVCGIRKSTLILNFPGSLKAVRECYSIVGNVLPHAINQIRGETCLVKTVHSEMQNKSNSSVSPISIKRHVCPHKTDIGDIDCVAFRLRESAYPMQKVETALQMIRDEINVKDLISNKVEIIPVNHSCIDRILAEDVLACEPFPPFPASTKDGYACISSDLAGKRHVRGGIIAGDEENILLQPGTCARISTGACLPLGADCVVQVEDTKLLEHSEDGKEEYLIEIMRVPKPGQDLREVGSDIQMNEVILKAGSVIDSASLGVLCSLGVHTLTVIEKLSLGVLSTGNELQEPHEKVLKPGHIRDSNRIMLINILSEYATCLDLGIAPDDENGLKTILEKAFLENSIMITSGGVSMGEKDLIKHILVKHFSGKAVFGRVNMKPGKPTSFIVCHYKNQLKYVFGLPGNPVSAFVTCNLFVIPTLKHLSQRNDTEWPRIMVELDEDMHLDPRPEYARASIKLNHGKMIPTASLTGSQISSRLTSAVGAKVLVELPSSVGREEAILRKGSTISALIIGKP